MITDVYVFDNKMVMTFDEHGQQVASHQGPYDECKDKLVADAPEAAYHYGRYRQGYRRITREQFEKGEF